MGCHTWFYVHLPEKKNRWAELYIKFLQDSANKSLQMWKNMSVGEWKETLKNMQGNCENHNYWLTFDDEKRDSLLKDGWSKESIDREVEYHKCNTWEDVRDYFINHALIDINAANKLNNLEDLKNNLSLLEQHEFDCPFELIGDKIYVETSFSGLDKWPELSKDLRYAHDIFRIHNYSAEDCRSLEDCENRYLENRGEPLPVDARKFLEQYFKDYPDTIIRFG